MIYKKNMVKLPEIKRNIWVLGGTGFIGTALLNHLAEDPANRLHLLVHKNVPYQKLEKVNLISGSLKRFDYSWFSRYPPDIVFHLARMAGSGPLRRRLASHIGQQSNERLIRFLATLDNPPMIVYVSGSLMYGDQSGSSGADESTALNPIAYGRYYERAERPWISAGRIPGLKVQLVRPGWIVGPGSWFKVFFWDHYLKTGRVPVYGSGNQLMSLIQVEDLAVMITKGVEMYPGVLNLFAGNPLTQKEFSEIMAKILGVETENISIKSIRRKYGIAEAEALSSSIPMNTRYPELWNDLELKYPKPADMLNRTISLLKSKKGVFPELPEGSFV